VKGGLPKATDRSQRSPRGTKRRPIAIINRNSCSDSLAAVTPADEVFGSDTGERLIDKAAKQFAKGNGKS
jgi:hypothetical protein